MLKILILTIVLIAIVFILFGVKILFVKGGKFPKSQIGGNRELNKRGIHCAQTQDKVERKKHKVHHVHY
ncbi:MAG: hypothetical protein GXO47_13870 [Chlorobi bacterium]|nr:hypothetical protein [Chlorobiota bacterium]